MRKWRNWQTRTFEGRVVHTVRVQVPFLAPGKGLEPNALQAFLFFLSQLPAFENGLFCCLPTGKGLEPNALRAFLLFCS